ncbi:MAG: phenylalanine--tRNA ligase subunit beta, partial [Oscillospiraceae bacterium]|nr:phenylalanine--tRNA ligase subunit beta [Oscillospiraceae bacterium]
MKLSLNWIKDYVEIPNDIELSKLAYDLTMSTVEVEDMVMLRKEFDNMVVGVVLEVLPHPNADKLVVCKVDTGDEEIREIVCGGTNLSKNMKVAVARPGSMVRWHGEGDLIEMKKAKVRGVESYGMICASAEIGLFDLFPAESDEIIIDLSAFSAPAGTHLADALGLDDVILEIDNKSLTNRPDLWGHYGMAREFAAIYNLSMCSCTNDNAKSSDDCEPISPSSPIPYSLTPTPSFITIDDTTRCSRYIGVEIEGVSTKPAPFEIQSRIWRVGMRPINAIVDITNYVMLATGQPTHAFDSDVINRNIIVRKAADKEKLLLLSGKELTLSTEDLVIADEKEPIALAGVMGGEKDSILPNTKNIILEIASFNALSVRRTAMRHEIRTESSTRFEKNIDPNRCDITLSIAMELFADVFPDMKVTKYQDNFPVPLEKNEINVSLKWLEKRLGNSIKKEQMLDILDRLGFIADIKNDNMNIIVPSWRSTGDISIADDIVEEILRIHGLERFAETPIHTTFDGAINQPKVDIDRKIREYLAFRCGLQEIFTYPWDNDEYVNAVFPDTNEALKLSDPPSPTEANLRFSLIPNLCKATADNLRYLNEFAIFESAMVFSTKEYTSPYDKRESLPLQRRNVAGAIVGNPEDLDNTFRRTKGILEAISDYTHIEPISLKQIEKPIWADNTVWLNV